jgi:hypothetical protein
MMRFERTDDEVCAPRAQNGDDEFGRVALRVDHRRIFRQRGFGCVVEFRKRPASSVAQIAQGDFISAFPDHLLPAFVKHLFLSVISQLRFQLQAPSQIERPTLFLEYFFGGGFFGRDGLSEYFILPE